MNYDRAADSPEKCKALLEQAGFHVTLIRTEMVSDETIPFEQAITFFDERLDHPAWRPLKEAREDSIYLIPPIYQSLDGEKEN